MPSFLDRTLAHFDQSLALRYLTHEALCIFLNSTNNVDPVYLSASILFGELSFTSATQCVNAPKHHAIVTLQFKLIITNGFLFLSNVKEDSVLKGVFVYVSI